MKSLFLLRLLTDEFHDSIGLLLPTLALRRQLLKSSDVRALASAIRIGDVTKGDIREFVSEIMQKFRVGEYFHHNLALAALAVALEAWNSDLVEEYLIDLARLKAPELNISVRIARECLQKRFSLPKNDVRITYYPAAIQASKHDRRMRLASFLDTRSEAWTNIVPRKYETV